MTQADRPPTTTSGPRWSRSSVARAAAARACPSSRSSLASSTGPARPPKATWSAGSSTIIVRGRLPGIIGADRQWSFTHVDDVAAAHVAALTRGEPGQEYAAGGENAPQMRLFEVLSRVRGTPLPRRIPVRRRDRPGVRRGSASEPVRPAAPPDPWHRRDLPSRLAARQRARPSPPSGTPLPPSSTVSSAS